jgi:hypothetical protein
MELVQVTQEFVDKLSSGFSLIEDNGEVDDNDGD